MKKITVLVCLLLLLVALAGCSEASYIAFDKEEYRVTEGETFSPDVAVRPKKFEYELFSSNNTVLTVEGKAVVALKPGIATLTAVSGKKETQTTVYVLSKNSIDVNDPTITEGAYITFSVINYTSAQLESPVIRTLSSMLPGTDITDSFPALIGYELTWYSDPDGKEPLPEKVMATAGETTYYAVARERVNYFLLDSDGRVTGLAYPNLKHERLIFPETYNGATLTGVADYAFYGDTTIKEIKVPRTFAYIGNFSFAGCTSLESVTFAEGSTLTEIGSFAFGPTYTEPEEEEEEEEENDSAILSYLDSLLDSVGLTQLFETPKVEKEEGITINEDYCAALSVFDFPASLRSVGSYAFYHCNALATSVPEGLVTISYGAFRDSKITSVNLKNVKKIEAYAFYNCEDLATVEHTESVEECGGYAFWNTKLYNDQNKQKDVIYAGSIVVGCYSGLNRATLHNNTTLIADYAFNNKKQETLTVYFNDGGKVRIGWQSFYVTGYRTESTNQPIFSENLFLAVGTGEMKTYAAENPLLADHFCEKVTHTENTEVNYGIHSLLKLPSGKYAYDQFIAIKQDGISVYPEVIDLASFSNGINIVRINSYAIYGNPQLKTLKLSGVQTVARCAVTACENLTTIDFTVVSEVPQLMGSDSFLFDGFSKDCIVLVGEANYGAFRAAWAERTTARSKIRYEKEIKLYVGDDFYINKKFFLPYVGTIQEGDISVWYTDEECTKVANDIPVGTTALYAKAE